MTELADELKNLRLGLAGGASDDDFVARVMSSCRSEPKRAVSRLRLRTWAPVGALSAAALVALSMSLRAPTEGGPAPVAPTIVARGGTGEHLQATVQAFVGSAPPGRALPLLEGATLRPGEGIVVRYSNPAAEPAYLMVFAVDERGNVHWLHPAYLDESTNPESLPLSTSTTERLLPEVAEPEDAAAGLLRVYALISRSALDVKSVERKLGEGRGVVELFPEAEIEEWRCTWAP
jgi:hypothetical protein